MGSATVAGETRGGREPKDSSYVQTGMHGVPQVSAQVPGRTVTFQAMPHPLSCRSHHLPDRGCPFLAHQAAGKVNEPSSQDKGIITTSRLTSSLTRDQKPLLT